MAAAQVVFCPRTTDSSCHWSWIMAAAAVLGPYYVCDNTLPTTNNQRLNYGGTWQPLLSLNLKEKEKRRILPFLLLHLHRQSPSPLLYHEEAAARRRKMLLSPSSPLIFTTKQRLGISQIPATSHEIPVRCRNWPIQYPFLQYEEEVEHRAWKTHSFRKNDKICMNQNLKYS